MLRIVPSQFSLAFPSSAVIDRNNKAHSITKRPPTTTSAAAQIHHSNAPDNSSDTPKKGVKYLVEASPGLQHLPPEYVLPLPGNPLRDHIQAEIPVIDMSGLHGPPESRTATVKAISSACELWGFFRIVNHGIEADVMEGMVKAVEEFFGLSSTEKMKYASDDVLSPVRYGTSLNTSKKHSLHWRDYLRHYGHPFDESFHLWPLNPPNYRVVAKDYLEKMRELAMRLAGAISEGLGLDQGYLERTLLGEGSQILAANYYPRCPEPDKTLGLAAHSDHGILTFLMDNGVDGLQVRHETGWVAVHHVPGSFVVNLGDSMEIVSNGKYRSIEHRATVNEERTRISVAVAHGPNLSSVIGPASALIHGVKDELNYRPVLYADYVRLQQSSTVRGKSALDASRISINK